MKARKALQVVERAYDLDEPSSAWLQRVAEEAAAMVDGSYAGYAMQYRFPPGGSFEVIGGYIPGMDPTQAFADIAGALSDEEAAMWYPPGTIEGGFEELLAERFGDLEAAEVPRAFARHFGGSDMIGIGGADVRGNGLVVGVVVDAARLVGPARQTQRRLGVHLTTAMRLRASLGHADALEEAEAVFEADGTLAHAEGAATSLRGVLEAQVTRVDRTRAKSERSSTEDPLEVWQGLVEGRWSLIDRFDTDGRRFYVALVNPPAAVDARALSALEAQIVGMVVTGEPNKVIGYALGLSEGTVSARLSDAMRKLGIASRADLIRFGQTLTAA